MDKKQSVITNFIWRLLERGGTYVMNFAVSIVLARLLDPSLYGTIALVTAITTILQVFVDSGMANSLIQKKDTDDLDYSSVFYFNLGFCLLLYAGLFFAAPLISRLYKDPTLTPIVRVLGLTIVVSGVKNVLLGGEGLFNTIVTGPGHVWLQTMPISSVASVLRPYFPTTGA